MEVMSKVLRTIQEMYAKSGIAHVFLVEGNVQDFQPLLEDSRTKPKRDHNSVGYLKLPVLLERSLANDFDIVIRYDRHTWSCGGSEEEPKQFISSILVDAQAQHQAEQQTDVLAMLRQASGPSDTLSVDPEVALNQVEKLLHDIPEKKTLAVILDYTQSYLAATGWGVNRTTDSSVVRILRWAKDFTIHNSDHLVILLCEDYGALHPALREPDNAIEKLKVGYPTPEERKIFIESWIEENIDASSDGPFAKGAKALKKISSTDLSRASSALNYVAVEDILIRALTTGDMSYDFIKKRKDSMIRHSYGDIIEIMDPQEGWEVLDGMDYVRDTLQRMVIKPLQEGREKDVPMGILMMGAPGIGKSKVVEAVAKDVKFTVFKLSMGKIFNMYLGQSENRLDRALDLIESVTPCIVFMDEIDQTGGSRENIGGSGDTGKRVFGRLLSFLSDTGHRGKVVFMAATNRPDMMDDAMKRAGRFDKRIAFFPADKAGRKKQLKVLSVKHDFSVSAVSDDTMEDCLNYTDGWVPADLEALIQKAKELSLSTKPDKALKQAIQFTVPTVRPEAVRFMTGLALAEVNDLSILPDHVVRIRTDLIKQAETTKAEQEGFRRVRQRIKEAN